MISFCMYYKVFRFKRCICKKWLTKTNVLKTYNFLLTYKKLFMFRSRKRLPEVVFKIDICDNPKWQCDFEALTILNAISSAFLVTLDCFSRQNKTIFLVYLRFSNKMSLYKTHLFNQMGFNIKYILLRKSKLVLFIRRVNDLFYSSFIFYT